MKPIPSKPKQPIISIAMTDHDVISRVANLWNVKCHRRPPGGPNNKEFWSARIAGNPAADLMLELKPFMGKRRSQQIDRALEDGISVRRLQKRHGTVYCYRQGCRRPECKQAKHEEYLRLKRL